ncbi:ABC transporter ATP-binding protein, partial [Micrococcus luteus]|nr:ABC transporter ATP-binding protein [Micrococcus luteus]
RSSAMNQSFGPLIEITGGFGSLTLSWLGATLIQQRELTIGLLIAFTQYVGNFWEPINRLGQMYNQLLVAMASSERIFEFIDEKPSIDDEPGARRLPAIRG